MSRSGDGVWAVILTGRAFVILLLFSSPGCPRWSSTRSDDTGSVVRLRARTTTPDGVCPRCGSASRRVHAWHVRRLTDLPVAGRSVVIELHVRRLVCQDAKCPQRTFRQQVPELALRYARRTLRLTTTVGRLAITLAGRAGAAVLSGLGVAISRSTVLRVLMALPLPPPPTPRVLSVDDVARRNTVSASAMPSRARRPPGCCFGRSRRRHHLTGSACRTLRWCRGCSPTPDRCTHTHAFDQSVSFPKSLRSCLPLRRIEPSCRVRVCGVCLP